MSDRVRFTQLVVAPFNSGGPMGNLTYSVLGLSTDGQVYRYDPQCEGWIPWSDVVVSCRQNHPGRR